MNTITYVMFEDKPLFNFQEKESKGKQ